MAESVLRPRHTEAADADEDMLDALEALSRRMAEFVLQDTEADEAALDAPEAVARRAAEYVLQDTDAADTQASEDNFFFELAETFMQETEAEEAAVEAMVFNAAEEAGEAASEALKAAVVEANKL